MNNPKIRLNCVTEDRQNCNFDRQPGQNTALLLPQTRIWVEKLSEEIDERLWSDIFDLKNFQDIEKRIAHLGCIVERSETEELNVYRGHNSPLPFQKTGKRGQKTCARKNACGN